VNLTVKQARILQEFFSQKERCSTVQHKT